MYFRRRQIPVSYDYDQSEVYKLLLLGDGAVGKTRLIERFLEGFFDADYDMTESIFQHEVAIPIRGKFTLRVSIKDWPGQQNYKGKRSMFYRGVQMVMLVFDLTRPQTLNRLKDFWLRELEFNLPPAERANPIIGLLVGNKADMELEQLVTTEEGLHAMRSLSRTRNIDVSGYVETSAKDSRRVRLAFEQLIRRFADDRLGVFSTE